MKYFSMTTALNTAYLISQVKTGHKTDVLKYFVLEFLREE